MSPLMSRTVLSKCSRFSDSRIYSLPYLFLSIFPFHLSISLLFFCFFSYKVIINEMTASTERCMSPAYFARLHFPGACFSAWCSKPRSVDKYPWLSIDLGATYYVLFVATQGSADNEQNKYFVFKYKLRYSPHKSPWPLMNYKEKGKQKVCNCKS